MKIPTIKSLLAMNVYTSSGCSSQSSRQIVRPLQAYCQTNFIQRYSNNGGEGSKSGPISGHEPPRAPSTADEFIRVAQEKAKQGVASQTADKAEDAIKEATIGESSKFKTIKETYKEPVGKGNSTGDD